MKTYPFGRRPQSPPAQNHDASMYKEFDATQLFCPKCRQAVPVRKRLLLVLPDGDKYEYLCAYCATSVGTKIDRNAKPTSLIT
jgi:hypothetical protein